MTPRSAFDRKYMLMMLCYLVGSSTLSIIAPILPYQMKEKGISESYNGVIFCIFALAGFVASQFCGQYMTKIGPKMLIYCGLILFCVSHYQFSLLELVYSPTLFVVLAIVARICEGVSYGVIQSTTYGVSSQELPAKEFDIYARANSTAAGLGGGFALILGSFFFSLGGYMMPYVVLGTVFLALALIIYFTGALSENQNYDEDLYVRLNDAPAHSDSSTTFESEHIMDHRFAFGFSSVRSGCASIVISNICATFLDPIMALKLLEYDILADKSGYIFVFYVISYSLFGILGGIMGKFVEKRNLILCGYIVGFFTFCMIGHEYFIGTNILPLIMIGLFLNGLSCVLHNVFATMYVKAELMDIADHYNIDKEYVGGYFGGLKGSCNLLGYFLGPLISPYLYVNLGFEQACISLALFQLVFFGFFYFGTTDYKKPAYKKFINESMATVDV